MIEKKLAEQITTQSIRMQKPPISLGASESGGMMMGVLIGVFVGVGLALVVAWYLMKSQPQEKPGVRAPSAPGFMKPLPPKSDKEEEEETAVAAPQIDLNKPLQTKIPGIGGNDPARDPIADIAAGKTPEAKPEVRADTQFFVQTGVFNQRSEADAQKANLAMQGIQAQLSESAVDGNTVWRVRVGPFSTIEDTTSVRSKLTILGIKPTVIRVNRS
jgi:cell division protein FtsN